MASGLRTGEGWTRAARARCSAPLPSRVGLLVIWQAVGRRSSRRRRSCCRRRRACSPRSSTRPDLWQVHAVTTLDRDADRARRRHARSAPALALVMSFLPLTRRLLLPVMVVSQALSGLRDRAAARAVVRLRPRLEDRHGDDRDLLPGRLRLCTTGSRAPTRASSISPGSTAPATGRRCGSCACPSALPSLVTGIRLAAVYAPIGALIGEWVGASSGLGYAMLFANAPRADRRGVRRAVPARRDVGRCCAPLVDLAHRATSRHGRRKPPERRKDCHASLHSRRHPRRACRRVAAGCAADKLTVLLDWFVNPDHAPLVIAKEGGYFDRARPRRRPDRAGRSERAAAAGRRRAGGHRRHLPARPDAPGEGGAAARPLRHADRDAAQLPDRARRTGRSRRSPISRARRSATRWRACRTPISTRSSHRSGLTAKDVTLVNVNFNLVTALLSGQVDAAIDGYRNVELIQLGTRGQAGRRLLSGGARRAAL